MARKDWLTRVLYKVYDLNTPEPSTPKPYTLEWSSRNLRRLLLVLNTPPGAAAPTAASDFSWQADGAGRLLALRVQGLRLKASLRHRDCDNAPRACEKGGGGLHRNPPDLVGCEPKDIQCT